MFYLQREYQEEKYDFVSNLFPSPSTYPDGTSVEVFSSELLFEMENDAKKPSEREHVTFYIWKQPEKYKIHRLDYKEDLSKFRFNLDYKEDFEFIRVVFEYFLKNNEFFKMSDVIEWLKDNEKIFHINSHIITEFKVDINRFELELSQINFNHLGTANKSNYVILNNKINDLKFKHNFP